MAREIRYFNPRAPCGARLLEITTTSANWRISTHAPLAGRDSLAFVKNVWYKLFQPTRPLRGATLAPALGQIRDNISTHAPLAGRDERYGVEIEE